MKIWIARVADDNSDALKAYFTKEEAAATAQMYFDHLTDKERKTHRVSVEAYDIDGESDGRTAEEIFFEAVNEDDESIYNPTDYKEVTE